jgi:hypothetical protein
MNKKKVEVKRLEDIPSIEVYLDEPLELDLYDVGDNTAFYGFWINEEERIEITVIMDEGLIENYIPLASFLTVLDVQYMDFKFCDKFGDWNRRYIYKANE